MTRAEIEETLKNLDETLRYLEENNRKMREVAAHIGAVLDEMRLDVVGTTGGKATVATAIKKLKRRRP